VPRRLVRLTTVSDVRIRRATRAERSRTFEGVWAAAARSFRGYDAALPASGWWRWEDSSRARPEAFPHAVLVDWFPVRRPVRFTPGRPGLVPLTPSVPPPPATTPRCPPSSAFPPRSRRRAVARGTARGRSLSQRGQPRPRRRAEDYGRSRRAMERARSPPAFFPFFVPISPTLSLSPFSSSVLLPPSPPPLSLSLSLGLSCSLSC